MRTLFLIMVLGTGVSVAFGSSNPTVVLLEDDFRNLPVGPFSAAVGAQTEYHYLPEAAPKGNWSVSCFASSEQQAWKVLQEKGRHIMAQTIVSTRKFTHPLVIAGDALWRDYRVSVTFAPESRKNRCGLVFRYRNDRCYYFFGVIGNQAVLRMVKDATAFHKPYERDLMKADCTWQTGRDLNATVTVEADHIVAEMSSGIHFEVYDSTFSRGKIGLLSDVPCGYKHVKVTTWPAEKQHLDETKARRSAREKQLQDANPKPVLWKKISTEGFGVGRNLRFGDLDGDGQIDVLVGQIVQHGPRDAYCELSCMTAMTFDGEILWRIGKPDPEKNHLTNDVGFQIHDLDGDGKNEVIYCMNFEIIVADGKTGVTKYKAPTPKVKREMKYDRILGDCLYFCDLRGTGRDSDIIIKDRYWNLWALNDKLETLWTGDCVTGHYPFAYDVDRDGKDELMMGYTLFDDNGRKLWSLDGTMQDHADGVAFVNFRDDLDLRLLCAASDEGVFFTNTKGNILKHHYIGHGQNPATANFRDDLPGLETVSINFWGNQGIIHYYDAEGNIYYDFEPCQYGSMCLPINWTGRSEEFFVHNPNVVEGGMYDGWGRKVVVFPDDRHPDMCNDVLDLTGDCRDEVVVWDPHEIWVYTQSDNPKTGRLYRPQRNPKYNTSNYQATVSLPGWSE